MNEHEALGRRLAKPLLFREPEPPPRPGRRLARMAFRPRLSAVDLVTWFPLSTAVMGRYGLIAGVVVLIPAAALVQWVEDKVLGKEGNGDGR